MNNQDPIADMLTRIRNANRVGRRMVLIPKSKICTGIAQVLKDEGYIEEYDVIDDERQGQDRRQPLAQVLVRGRLGAGDGGDLARGALQWTHGAKVPGSARLGSAR